MKNIRWLLLLPSLVICAWAGDPAVVHKRVSEVQLTLVATDRNDRPLSNLSPSDISVLENGQPVSQFNLRSASDLPLRLGIVLDLSDSTRKSWPIVHAAFARSAAEVYRPQDQLLVLTFNSKIEIDRTFADPAALGTALEKPGGGGLTALYDTVYRVCGREMFQADAEPHRSAIILLSDGEDDISLHELNDAIRQAQLNGIAIYTISTHNPRVSTNGDTVLQTLAAATGGRDFVVKDATQLQSALSSINQELRHSYLVYYRTADDGATRNFRRVFVLSTRHDGSHMRSRAGYFTGP
jgi:VWFA-related protein